MKKRYGYVRESYQVDRLGNPILVRTIKTVVGPRTPHTQAREIARRLRQQKAA